MLKSFVKVNVSLARSFDRLIAYPPINVGSIGPKNIKEMFVEGKIIADVGGGKKPYAAVSGLSTDGKSYVGIDLDTAELESAPAGVYTEKLVMDICAPEPNCYERFDLIICRNTLEHVKDAAAAFEGISRMLSPNGRCYIKVPCRKAFFARLNLLLPNDVKRRIMHAIFPEKKGDGFPAFYDRTTPIEFSKLARLAGLEVVAEKRNYRSTYFSFFFPLYLLWRGFSSVQYLIDRNYCESFDLVLHKSAPAITPT